MWLDHAISFPNLGITIEHLTSRLILFGGMEIAVYGILIGTGIVAGFLMTQWQAVRTGQDKELYLDFALYAVILSILGARLFYVVFSWDQYRENPIQILNFRGGGMAIYGAVLTALLTAFFYSKLKRVRFGRLVDTCCVGLLTGQVIGRWGNFVNREAFGGYTDNLFAMRLSLKDVASSSVTEEMYRMAEAGGYSGFIQVHPTFLYESAWNLLLLILLLCYTKRKKFDGELFLFYLMGYGLCRAFIEGLRTDQLLVWGTQIPVSQFLSVLLALCALVVWMGRRLRAYKKNLLLKKKP